MKAMKRANREMKEAMKCPNEQQLKKQSEQDQMNRCRTELKSQKRRQKKHRKAIGQERQLRRQRKL